MLVGKNIVITGSMRGIGKSTVEKCAYYGANIWACARNGSAEFENELNLLAKKYNVQIWPVYFDLSDENQIKNAVKEIKKQHLQIDALVNCAGVIPESHSFQMMSIDSLMAVLNVNLIGTTILTQYISRIMVRQKHGNIVNISSIAALDGIPGQYEYVTSKAALIGSTIKLANELANDGIRVNAIAPGIIETEMSSKMSDFLKETVVNQTMMKRLGKPEEIANVIAFLSSDLSSYITGQVIRVDGGRI